MYNKSPVIIKRSIEPKNVCSVKLYLAIARSYKTYFSGVHNQVIEIFALEISEIRFNCLWIFFLNLENC